ncbi:MULTISPECIES: hypothetical protein [unclassified Pseudoxanthomonas]|uniref:hypothetical protein n=1 Tax=unclassified Pseudoxanthomonas TaxID=2645906 RepID=UPI0008EC7BBB|nr:MULTISPECIES: hypothetical protein [unclassified Pseudoxanthomonas]PPJ43126.1 hypothetical protein C0063_07890 [Pseudoxanthomonas sp. KAs_5_3]SFV34260.1 hypothetical protein SAMN05428990_2651 [Pseudoxanthomonas sp. YR558]
MKIGRLILLLVLLSLLGMLAFWLKKSSQEEEAPRGHTLSADNGAPAAQGSAGTVMPNGALGAPGETSLPALHRERIEVGDALWEATTPEQAAWLNRNGFPTSQQLAAFNGAKAAQLPSDGLARSPADVTAAESVAMSDPSSKAQALSVLKNASEAGSSYALQSLARIAQLSEGDPVKAEGYYRAAILRGDWLVGLRETPRLSPEQNYAADLRAFRIIAQINLSRRQRGLPPLAMDVRPGANEALDQLLPATKRQGR